MQETPMLEIIRKNAATVFSQYPVSRAAVFGSCARGEMNSSSDIDLLIEFENLESGLILVEIKRRMERKLKRKVDLITYNSLQYSKHRDEILREARIVYEKNH